MKFNEFIIALGISINTYSSFSSFLLIGSASRTHMPLPCVAAMIEDILVGLEDAVR